MPERKINFRKRKRLGAVAASVAIGGVLVGCGADSEKSHVSLRESLAQKSGTGFEVLTPAQEKELGIDTINPKKLQQKAAQQLYLNESGDKNRLEQWVFPKSYAELAGETSHFSIDETGKPAVIIVPKGFDIREVTYVDNVNNDEERNAFYTGENTTSKEGDVNTTRVFYGVDGIIMDVWRQN